MGKRLKMSRITRSRLYANIIHSNNLFEEFNAYRLMHHKIKSLYRLANLFLMNKKLRWSVPDNYDYFLTMENLSERYFNE